MSYHKIRFDWFGLFRGCINGWMKALLSFTKHLFRSGAFFDRTIGRHPFLECPSARRAHFLQSGLWPVFRFWPRLYDYVSRMITKCACISVIINSFFSRIYHKPVHRWAVCTYIIYKKQKKYRRAGKMLRLLISCKGVPRMDHICMFARSSVTRRSKSIDANGQQVAGALKAVFSRWVIVS